MSDPKRRKGWKRLAQATAGCGMAVCGIAFHAQPAGWAMLVAAVVMLAVAATGRCSVCAGHTRMAARGKLSDVR